MKKQYTINITNAHSGTFKVVLRDHNGNSNTVYEMSVENALNKMKDKCQDRLEYNINYDYSKYELVIN